jgi:hypothetical protein
VEGAHQIHGGLHLGLPRTLSLTLAIYRPSVQPLTAQVVQARASRLPRAQVLGRFAGLAHIYRHGKVDGCCAGVVVDSSQVLAVSQASRARHSRRSA